MVLAVLPFQVSAPSRVLSVATLNTNIQLATVYAAVTDAQGVQVLGTSSSGTQHWNASDIPVKSPPITAQGVVHAGRTPIDPSAMPLVLSPGAYRLEMRESGHDCSVAFPLDSATLTYVLLSSVFDRIFAAGFA